MLLRLATIGDFVPYDFAGQMMFKVKWEEHLCPGSPCADPAIGVTEYNEYVVKRLSTEDLPSLEQVFMESLDWLATESSPDAKAYAQSLLDRLSINKPLSLPIATGDSMSPVLRYRYAAAFLNGRIADLTSSRLATIKAAATWKTDGQ